MTNAALQRIVTDLADTYLNRKGYDPRPGVKGGKREIANALIAVELLASFESILTKIGAPAPAPTVTVTAPAGIEDAA